MIETICPKCGNIKNFSEDKAGKKFKCPSCQEIVMIEATSKQVNNQNVSETYQQNIVQQEDRLQDLKEERNAANERQYQRLLKKSRTWNGWGTAFYVLAGIAIIMVFTEDTSQLISVAFWGGLGMWFKKKSKGFKDQADNFYNENFENNTTSAVEQSISNADNETSLHGMSVNASGLLNVSFPGQWFLMDANTKIFVNDTLHSTHSTKNGFNVAIPLTSDKMTLKLVLAGMKSTTYELEELDLNKNYTMELEYSDTWGRYSNKFNFQENG